MIEFVIDMSKNRPFRFELCDGRQGLIQTKVGGMRFKTQSIQDEDVQPGQRFFGFIRQTAAISNISRVVDLVSQYRHVAMDDVDGSYLHAAQGKGLTVQCDHVEFRHPTAHWLFPVEDIAEVFLNDGQGQIVAIAGDDGLVEKVEAAQFVDAVYMIGVMVRVQHSVDLRDVVLEALLPEVRRGVDQDIESIVLDQNRGSEAFVARIVRLTDIARTA